MGGTLCNLSSRSFSVLPANFRNGHSSPREFDNRHPKSPRTDAAEQDRRYQAIREVQAVIGRQLLHGPRPPKPYPGGSLTYCANCIDAFEAPRASSELYVSRAAGCTPAHGENRSPAAAAGKCLGVDCTPGREAHCDRASARSPGVSGRATLSRYGAFSMASRLPIP